MRDNADATKPTGAGKPIALGAGGVLTLGTIAEYTEQVTPILHALQTIDYRIVVAVIGAVLLGAFIWFIRKDKAV